jgi:hypothetical protein
MLTREQLMKGIRNPVMIPPFILRTIKWGLLDRYYDYDSKETNVYDRDWDLLLILDGCRVDTLQEVSEEYEFLPDTIPHITSVAGGSPKWLANTFTEEWIDKIRETGYISANPHTRRVLGEQMEGLFTEVGGPEDRLSDFAYFAPVWETHWDSERETVPARAVTDHLIEYYRNEPANRTIVHYMQPHFPSVPDPIGGGMDISDDAHWNSDNIWTLIEQGDASVEEAYNSYTENLRYVLDDVELVLSNIDEENVVITADHGNAFGEWREYGHGIPCVGSVRDVPWVETSATNTENYAPSSEQTSQEETSSVEEKLQALGYKM